MATYGLWGNHPLESLTIWIDYNNYIRVYYNKCL